MASRFLILTPAALREKEPELIDVVTRLVTQSKTRVTGAYSYVDKHGAKLAALHPEMEPLKAWAVFAGEGELPGQNLNSVPVFTDYVVPVTSSQVGAGEVLPGVVNGYILFLAEPARKGLWFLLLGDVNAELVKATRMDLRMERDPRLVLADDDKESLLAAVEKVAAKDAAAARALAEGVE